MPSGGSKMDSRHPGLPPRTRIERALRASPERGRFSTKVERQSARPKRSKQKAKSGRPARTAHVTVHYRRVEFRPPAPHKKQGPLSVWAVYVHESDPPQGVEQRKLERCLDAIEAPCSLREQRVLREVFRAEHPSDEARVKAVIEAVEEIGLEPFRPPVPLPPIEQDEVHLICWMAIEAQYQRLSYRGTTRLSPD